MAGVNEEVIYYWCDDKTNYSLPCRLLGHEKDMAILQYESNTPFKLEISKLKDNQLPDSFVMRLKDPYEDLENSDDISDRAMLYNLRKRYSQHDIYSSIGSIVIAVNPYAYHPQLYSKEIFDTIRNTSKSIHEKPPHIWNTTQSAYDQLRATSAPQAIVISGESGAGKYSVVVVVVVVVVVCCCNCYCN